MTFQRALAEDDLWIGETRGIELGGVKLLLVNVEGCVTAFEDRCQHQGWPLSRGRLEDGTLICALHGWRYDARTGAGVNPRGCALRSFAVRVASGAIEVDVDGAA